MQHITWPVIALALMTAACDNGGAVRITTSTTSDSSGVLKVVGPRGPDATLFTIR